MFPHNVSQIMDKFNYPHLWRVKSPWWDSFYQCRFDFSMILLSINQNWIWNNISTLSHGRLLEFDQYSANCKSWLN